MALLLAAVEPGDLGLAERVPVDVVADERRGRARRDVELVNLEREHRECVVMVPTAWGRARAAVAWLAEVGRVLGSTLRQGATLRDRGRRRRDVVHNPVPPARPGRRI